MRASSTFIVRGFWNRLGVLLTGRVREVTATGAPVIIRRTRFGFSGDQFTILTTPEEMYGPRPLLHAEWPCPPEGRGRPTPETP